MKKWYIVLLSAFVLNLIWENLHRFLYIAYLNGPITELVLFRAAIIDALIISIVIRLYEMFLSSKSPWYIFMAGLVISIGLEKWALATGRWQYNGLMPIIPFIKTGLTPTLQLGSIGYLVYRLVFNSDLKNKS